MRPVPERPSLPQAHPTTFAGVVAYTQTLVKQLVRLFQDVGFRVNRTLPKDGSEAMEGPLPLSTYTIATLPPAAQHEGAIVYVSDGLAGEKFRGSDGATWVNLG